MSGCTKAPPPAASVTPELAEASESEDPLAVLDELEQLIEAGSDTEDERVFAYDRISKITDDGSAGWAFARAAVAGRVAETRGAGAGKLVTEAEAHARLSLERDENFRDGAATRMLGTLYVMAPARLVEHGDAEVGLEMLEALAKAKPDDPRNRLRAAEAYINLGDPEPAIEHLCAARSGQDALRVDERKLLASLVEDAGGESVVECSEPA